MNGKHIVSTNEAPAAIGPYSQAVEAGGFLFLSGQIPLDPVTGEMCGDTVAAQTAQVLKNMQGVLRASGLSLSNVVKTTIFLADMRDFSAVNEVYAGYFSAAPPARSTVAVKGLPKGALVEIEAVAWKG